MSTMCNDQIRVISISTSLNIYPFLVLGSFELLSFNYLKYKIKGCELQSSHYAVELQNFPSCITVLWYKPSSPPPSSLSLPALTSNDHCSTLLPRINVFSFSVQVRTWSVCLPAPDLSHLPQCLPVSSMLPWTTGFHSPLHLHNIFKHFFSYKEGTKVEKFLERVMNKWGYCFLNGKEL